VSRPNPVLRNIIANYASQIYVIVLGLAVIPLYLRFMGINAYGLVGFFTMLLAWMTVFDFGLGPAFGREASKFKAGKISASTLNLFLLILEKSYLFLGACVILACWVSGDWVADIWLNLDVAHQREASTCITLVGVMFCLRLMSNLYRSGLLGLENQAQANVVLVIIATLRSVLVLPILIWVSSSILTFFTFQFCVAIVETVLLRAALKRSLPDRQLAIFKWSAIRETFRFSGGVAFLGLVWIATSQIDKLILSHLLSLREYAEFILATTLALGVYSLISPLQQAVLPRLVIFSEQDRHELFVSLYRLTSMLMVAIVAGVAGAIVAYPEQVLYVWTGDQLLSEQVAEILRWYAAGTGFMAIAGMSYVLQNAKGNLSLHIRGNILCLVLLIPTLIASTLQFGAIGAAISWAAVNFFFLVFWTSVVHKKFLPELTWRWLLFDIAPGIGVAALLVSAAHFTKWPFSLRSISFIALVMLTSAIVGVVLIIHHETRKLAFDQISKLITSICKKIR
jgi:O-antigen/teichoic acid export membrane protein